MFISPPLVRAALELTLPKWLGEKIGPLWLQQHELYKIIHRGEVGVIVGGLLVM